MAKIGHKAKAICFAKWFVWLRIKIAKAAENVSRDALELFCAKKGRQKIPNIREMRSFRKFSKLALMIFMLLTKRKIYRPGYWFSKYFC